MIEKDFIKPFMIEDTSANGRFVDLDDSINDILSKHLYPVEISKILSELCVISCFLGQNLKKDGIITSQIRSKDGALQLAVSEFTYGGDLRACASLKDSKDKIDGSSFLELVGSGYLLVTIEADDERYQGVIELSDKGIAESFKDYLKKSEQISSELQIFTSVSNVYDEIRYKARGIILKKMPLPANYNVDNWSKFSAYMNSLSNQEVMDNTPEEILRRLFHADGVILYDSVPVQFKCRCSREKMEKAFKSVSQEDLDQYRINGKISIKCEFCNTEEFFQ